MKIKTLTSCFFLAFAISSCIQDEALNAEADIETCSVPGDVLNREPIIGNDEITLPLKKGADITKLLLNSLLHREQLLNRPVEPCETLRIQKINHYSIR